MFAGERQSTSNWHGSCGSLQCSTGERLRGLLWRSAYAEHEATPHLNVLHLASLSAGRVERGTICHAPHVAYAACLQGPFMVFELRPLCFPSGRQILSERAAAGRPKDVEFTDPCWQKPSERRQRESWWASKSLHFSAECLAKGRYHLAVNLVNNRFASGLRHV